MKRLLLGICCLLLAACSHNSEPLRAVYHWKTTYNPTQWELNWMRDHRVQRLYLRMFDVDMVDGDVIPVATTRFLQPLPDDMEIVPVVYVTNEAMDNEMWWNERNIVDRVLKMAECKGFEVKELQIDCDWTERTKDRFYWFCHQLHGRLQEENIRLGITVRLHQIDSTLGKFEADTRTLMLYNTGDFRSPLTRNSILDYDDVKPYLRRLTAETMDSMAVAWPVFGWGVAFDKTGHFSHLVGPAAIKNDTTQRVREEWGEMEEMLHVQKRLSHRRGNNVTVLYHLDSLNLSRYSYDEIEALYSR